MATFINGAEVVPSIEKLQETDFSKVTARPEFVAAGKTFYDETGQLRVGTSEPQSTTSAELENAYTNGQKSEYDRFWDICQQNGKRENYQYAFAGYGWDENLLIPKYDLIPTRADYMFAANTQCFDLVEHLNGLGIKLDTSNCVYVGAMFAYCHFCRVGVLDITKTTSTYSIFGNSCIVTIDKLIVKDDGSTAFDSTFYKCTYLENLTIEGAIGQNGFDVQWSPLTHDSLMSIINALADKSGTSGTWTVTLGSTNKAKLTEAELLIAENKGWTVK